MKKYFLILLLASLSALVVKSATTIGGPTISPTGGISSNAVYNMIITYGVSPTGGVTAAFTTNVAYSISSTNNTTGNAATSGLATNVVNSPITNNSSIYVDPIYGDDSTGQIDNPAKPFQSITRVLVSYTDDDDNFIQGFTNGAMSVASPFDVIYLAPGNYTNTNTSIVLKMGMSLVGSGPSTVIYHEPVSAAGAQSVGAAITLADNSTVSGVKVICSPLTDAFRFPIGLNYEINVPYPRASFQSATNFIVKDSQFYGQSDGAFFNHTNTFFGSFYNCYFTSDWDGVLFSTRGNTNSFLNFYDCKIQLNNGTSITHTYVAGILVDSGTVNYYGGSIVANDGPQNTMGVWVRTNNAIANIFGTTILTSSTNGTVYNVTNNGGLLNLMSVKTDDEPKVGGIIHGSLITTTNTVLYGDVQAGNRIKSTYYDSGSITFETKSTTSSSFRSASVPAMLTFNSNGVVTVNTSLGGFVTFDEDNLEMLLGPTATLVGGIAQATNLPITGLQGSGGAGTAATNGTAGQALLSAGNGGVYWGTAGGSGNPQTNISWAAVTNLTDRLTSFAATNMTSGSNIMLLSISNGAIANSTINSNKLDAATIAWIQSHGGGSGTNYGGIVSNSIILVEMEEWTTNSTPHWVSVLTPLSFSLPAGAQAAVTFQVDTNLDGTADYSIDLADNTGSSLGDVIFIEQQMSGFIPPSSAFRYTDVSTGGAVDVADSTLLTYFGSSSGGSGQTPFTSDINAAGYSLTNLNSLSVTGQVNIGTLTTTNLVGNGASLTNLNGTNIQAGTIESSKFVSVTGTGNTVVVSNAPTMFNATNFNPVFRSSASANSRLEFTSSGALNFYRASDASLITSISTGGDISTRSIVINGATVLNTLGAFVGPSINTAGTITATNGIASYSPTTPVPIASGGWTNIWATNSAIVYFNATSATWTNREANGAGIYTNETAFTGPQTIYLQPSEILNIDGTGVTGFARPF